MSAAGGRSAPKEPQHPKQIAGVVPVAISDAPPYHAAHEAHDHTEHLRRKHAAAWELSDRELGDIEVVNEQSPRHAPLSLGLFGPVEQPLFRFLLNDSLLEAIEVATAEKGSVLSQTELLHIALACDEGAVDPNFSSGAINAINASYFASPVAFAQEAFLANMYTASVTLNYALGGLIARLLRPKDHLKVKEIASGAKTDHWLFMAEGMRHKGVKDLDIVLTDFVLPPLSAVYDAHPYIHPHTAVYNVFDDFPVLPKADRLDAIFASYAFDSIWQPEDLRLTKVVDQWYQSAYRLKVADWNPRKDELIAALRLREPLQNAQPGDYMGIFIEEVREKVDLDEHPYGDFIRNCELSAVNVPGGMIKRVVQAFDSQLGDNGIFVIGDAMQLGAIGMEKPFYLNACEVTGVAARYKIEDYMLGRDILEDKYGLRVDLVTFPELAAGYLPAGWQDEVPAIEREQLDGKHGNAIIVVSRGSKT